MSEIGARTLDAAFSEGLRGRGALVALVFFRGLPLPLLTEGAVGGLRNGGGAWFAEGVSGREVGALESLA